MARRRGLTWAAKGGCVRKAERDREGEEDEDEAGEPGGRHGSERKRRHAN